MVAEHSAVRINSHLGPEGQVVISGVKRGDHPGWTAMVTPGFAAEVAQGVMHNYPMAPASNLIGTILALANVEPPVVNQGALIIAMGHEIDNRAARQRTEGEQG